MAANRLAVRTLALAMIALVMACAKAAIGEPDGTVPRAPKAAGSLRTGSPTAGANVGTMTSNGGSGSGQVKTVTSARGSAVGSVATVLADYRTITRAGGSPPGGSQAQPHPSVGASRPAARPTARPTAAGRTNPIAGEPAVTVRRVPIGAQGDADTAPAPEPAPVSEPEDPKVRAALRTEAPARSMSRNAFSLGMSPLGQMSPP
jgi:hypothetical protein